jgi:hypothetical protein
MNLIFNVPNSSEPAQDADQVQLINFTSKADSEESQPIQIVFKNMDKLPVLSVDEQLEESWNSLLLPQIEQAFAPIEKDKKGKKLRKQQVYQAV